jgi:glycosyltransferase involved in cell wall biosynthesis
VLDVTSVHRRRLLSVAHSYVVGLNRRLAHELARAGGDRWEVTCVAPRQFHGDLGPIELKALPGEPCQLEPVNAYLSKRIHVFFYGSEARDLLRRDWDVVHAWEEPYVFAGYQLARWAHPRTKYAFSTLQNITKRYPPPFSWFERSVLRRADAWLYCGKTVFDTLNPRRAYASRPSAPAPLGVDLQLFAPDPEARRSTRERLGWSADGPPVVGFLGRFVADKGLALLAAALDAVRQPFRVLFVGGGPERALLDRWARHHGDRVRIASATHTEVPAYLNAMDMLCAPSQTTPHWREQFGRMLVEAMACGVPVLGSDSGEIPFVVSDAGRVLPERNVGAWVKAIEEQLGDAALRRELSERGLERVHREYAWPVVAARQLAFFERLAEDR